MMGLRSGNRSFLYADIVRSIEHSCLVLHFLLPPFSTLFQLATLVTSETGSQLMLTTFVVTLLPDNRYLACLATVEQLIGFLRLLEGKAMGYQRLKVELPAHQIFDKILHLGQTADP